MLIILLLQLSLLFVNPLTPLSECTLGRITGYDGYEEGGSCGFGVPKMYGAAPNQAFYNNGEQCGICYEAVGPNGVLKFMVDSFAQMMVLVGLVLVICFILIYTEMVSPQLLKMILVF